MEQDKYTDKQALIADFRYGIIADLLNPHLEKQEIARLITQKAQRLYDIPFSARHKFSPACIRHWLKLYKDRGKDGLVPKTRKDAGVCKSLTDEEKENILKVLEKKPFLHVSDALRVLRRQGALTHEVAKSSLSRFIISSGFTRRERLANIQPTDTAILRFAYQYPLECVQVDAMHSFKVPDGKGVFRKAILIACIDDATRRIVYSNFAFTENSVEFEKAVKHILLAHGRIVRLYTDNGSTFISLQTKRILDSLGIVLIHSKPGVPKGRGKIERFFRTVRAQFERTLEENSITSIGGYDSKFKVWLESEYHRTPHSGIENKTPLDAWLAASAGITHLEAGIDLNTMFCHEEFRKVAGDATVSIGGKRFEVPVHLIGKKVKLRFDPQSAVRVINVYLDGKFMGNANVVQEYANARTKRTLSDEEPAVVSLLSSSGGVSTGGSK